MALLGFLILLFAGQSSAVQWNRDESEKALIQARELRDQLADAQGLDKSGYLRCIRLYRRVWLSDPHYGGCDDAIYEAALLYGQMSVKFDSPEYNQAAANLLRFLVKDYSVSPFRRDARARLEALGDRPSGPIESVQSKQSAERQTAPANTAVPVSPAPGKPLSTAVPTAPGSALHGRPTLLRNIRHWTTSDHTRVIIDLDGPVQFQSVKLSSPDRLYFDLSDSEVGRELFGKTIAVGDRLLKQIRVGQNKPDVARVVLDFSGDSEYSVSELSDPFRIVIDIRNSDDARDALASGAHSKPGEASGQVSIQTLRPAGADKASGQSGATAVQKPLPLSQADRKPGEAPAVPTASKPIAAATLQSTQVPSRAPHPNGKEAASPRTESVAGEKIQPFEVPGPIPGEKAVIGPLPAVSPTLRPVDAATLQKNPALPPAKIPTPEPPSNGQGATSPRSESVVVEKVQLPGAPGPKPGEKAVIETIAAIQPSVRPADNAMQQKNPELPTAQQVPAPESRLNGKEAASIRTDTAVGLKTQPSPPAAARTVEATGLPKSASPAPSSQAGVPDLSTGATSVPGESEGRTKTPGSAASASMASATVPSLVTPAAKPLQGGEILLVPPRAAPDVRETRRNPPAESSPKTSTTGKVAAADSSLNSVRDRDIPPAKSATPTSRGDMTLTRVLGLKVGRIMLDPGHGGHDTGTIGRNGLMEKNLVLDVALSLKKALEGRLGAQVLMTRTVDRFISLEERTGIANRHKADLFVSIHANASSSRSTSGVETYYLNFARSAADREIAARENATTLLNIGELQDLVRKIAMADKSTESRELAAVLQRSLYSGSRGIFPKARNRGVRSAPFIVLIGAEMPAVLVEVAFISNPRDEKLLKKENSQQVLAQALLTGIEGYLKSLASYMANNHPGSN